MGSEIQVGDKIICLVPGLFVNKELVITEIDKIFFWAYRHDLDSGMIRLSFTISNENKTYKRAKKKIG